MIAGAITQASRPIGSAAAAQMPRIFPREYCSLRLSLGGPPVVDSPSTPPRAICPSALIFSILLPNCCFYQGKVFSVSGRSRGSPPFGGSDLFPDRLRE